MTLSYNDALEAVESRLGAKAAAHSRRVGDAAADLAILYGADPVQARLAGLLHDWDREQEPGGLLRAATDAEMTLDAVEIAHPRLLHARTGALAVRDVLPGVPPDVAQAVARHTVGSPDMTPLDMVVYIADMIEPHRDFPGVSELRQAVGVTSLAELFALAYQQSVLHLVLTRKNIHPDTVEVWNAFVAGESR